MPKRDDGWLDAFARGLYGLAEKFNVDLVGGDTVRGPLSISVQILGLVESPWLTRGGAKPGDVIFVSGVPGEAAAGLSLLQKGSSGPEATRLIDRFLWPEPRVDLGRKLRTTASAAIDVSDGLLADLGHICAQSRCGAHIDLELLPMASLREMFDCGECERFALCGGDDYEILFTVSPERILDVEAAVAAGTKCTPIGRIVEGRDVACFRRGRRMDIAARGYDHFD
jgi:thiamine-monophosphate kinase